jgi:putative ABC transport system permease protein
MFGITVGVASVIVIIGISQGVKNEITNQVYAYSKNVITVTSKAANLSNFGVPQIPTVSTLTNQDVSSISKIKGVKASVPMIVESGLVTGEKTFRGGVVIATSPDLPSVINQSLAYGSFFSSADTSSDPAVLGYNASSGLFKENVPLGFSFTWRGQTFIVDGVLNSFRATPFSNNTLYNNAIFIPVASAKQLIPGGGSLFQILVRVDNSKDLSQVAARISAALLRNHGGQSNFSVLLPSQVAQNNTGILNLLTELTIGIALISLFVGGVGIMNVMLVSVAERIHEIGIRKAIGASNRQVMSQFLVESTTVSITGGLIGIGLALIADLVLKLSTNLSPSINWEIIVIGAAVSMLIGIVFGSIPAIRAAGKEPIEALRNE